MRHSQLLFMFSSFWIIRISHQNETSLHLKAETQLSQWSLIWVCIYQWFVWGVSLQYKQWFTHSNGLLWIKANEAWGSLLTNGEPWRRQHALSGDSILISRIGGNFPIEMRSRCLSFSVSSLRPCFCLLSSFGQTWPSAPSSPPGTGEEHEHHGKGGCPWAQSHDEGELFVGDTALGTELWAHGAGPSAPNFLME